MATNWFRHMAASFVIKQLGNRRRSFGSRQFHEVFSGNWSARELRGLSSLGSTDLASGGESPERVGLPPAGVDRISLLDISG